MRHLLMESDVSGGGGGNPKVKKVRRVFLTEAHPLGGDPGLLRGGKEAGPRAVEWPLSQPIGTSPRRVEVPPLPARYSLFPLQRCPWRWLWCAGTCQAPSAWACWPPLPSLSRGHPPRYLLVHQAGPSLRPRRPMAESLLSSPPRLRGSPSPPLPSSGRGRLGALGAGGGRRQSRDARKGRRDVITGLWRRGFDYLFPGVAPVCGAESLSRKSVWRGGWVSTGSAAWAPGQRHLLTLAAEW